MKLTLIILIAALVIGGSIISYGYLTNQQPIEVVEKSTPYEKLTNYKEELEKINQYNQKILSDLQQQISDSDDENLEQLKQEIQVLKRVIDENKVELDQVIQKLSKMESTP
ncbi:hypothetical protein NsoK4_09835 [Nitrosopumilus sp. K4]|uniref:hypothetical protein n=1 Tax=Nitrosopumilus sp. K4 TaxID=2795383 RepID=UPI001BA7E68C|nr:hypothetical protein [Nitrosopumilus sp. K4]QUC64692.1 hypothetical protein NsoK4_09835 [Nitrosopumilus sp. K4]